MRLTLDLRFHGPTVEPALSERVLTAPGDMPGVASAVVRLLAEEQLRAQLGQAALREAVEHYSWQAHVGRILRALGGAHDS